MLKSLFLSLGILWGTCAVAVLLGFHVDLSSLLLWSILPAILLFAAFAKEDYPHER